MEQNIKYYNDYPTKPIGDGNPYSCCSYCEVSEPEINGRLEEHREWCTYRKQKESFLILEDFIELIENSDEKLLVKELIVSEEYNKFKTLLKEKVEELIENL